MGGSSAKPRRVCYLIGCGRWARLLLLPRVDAGRYGERRRWNAADINTRREYPRRTRRPGRRLLSRRGRRGGVDGLRGGLLRAAAGERLGIGLGLVAAVPHGVVGGVRRLRASAGRPERAARAHELDVGDDDDAKAAATGAVGRLPRLVAELPLDRDLGSLEYQSVKRGGAGAEDGAAVAARIGGRLRRLASAAITPPSTLSRRRLARKPTWLRYALCASAGPRM